ncbi:methylated DNA-protein cysteine methyltransferase [Candidatus Scalindua japonica]|uniref:methylated-DNA--[protein]-cysteine S-methyltransferase n=1 Tax=Candidatus Scalindua japonica TaxID=1284222 RepID=A0A286TY34_9BACT|nr:methylated-DNA--[protein]-cysteine S-methyltransferase [Candidatus Scalindua japonica]GAX60780.1 methylated DNA-protein cysteine methyltransferase [Candidatus Scalindua japonica]
MTKTIYYSHFNSPFGTVFIAKTASGICFIHLSTTSESQFQSLLKKRFRENYFRDDDKLDNEIDELIDYFNGDQVNFKSALDLSIGTEFQRKVWEKIGEIPYGELRTYKWIASKIGNPNAVRAVGNAVGQNPVPPIIPCHRVIRSDGNLGGFSSGISLKKWLLKLEK